MATKSFLTAGLILGLSPLALFAGPKEDAQAALKKLKDAPNYSWTAKSSTEGGARTMPSTLLTGKAEKGGFAHLSQSTDNDPIEVVLKGDKGVLKTSEGWKAAADLPQPQGGGGGQDPAVRATMIGRRLLQTKLPADDLAAHLEKASDIQAADGAVSGKLSPDSAKELLSFGRGRRGAFEPKDASGTLKYWIKEGSVTKAEVQVSGKIAGRDGNEFDLKRSTVIEFKDVGATQVSIPDDAKKKLTL